MNLNKRLCKLFILGLLLANTSTIKALGSLFGLKKNPAKEVIPNYNEAYAEITALLESLSKRIEEVLAELKTSSSLAANANYIELLINLLENLNSIKNKSTTNSDFKAAWENFIKSSNYLDLKDKVISSFLQTNSEIDLFKSPSQFKYNFTALIRRYFATIEDKPDRINFLVQYRQLFYEQIAILKNLLSESSFLDPSKLAIFDEETQTTLKESFFSKRQEEIRINEAEQLKQTEFFKQLNEKLESKILELFKNKNLIELKKLLTLAEKAIKISKENLTQNQLDDLEELLKILDIKSPSGDKYGRDSFKMSLDTFTKTLIDSYNKAIDQCYKLAETKQDNSWLQSLKNLISDNPLMKFNEKDFADWFKPIETPKPIVKLPNAVQEKPFEPTDYPPPQEVFAQA